MTDFKTWDRTVLERFATEASDRLREQRTQMADAQAERGRLQAEIDALRGDLKTALGAYRRAVTSSRPSPSQTS